MEVLLVNGVLVTIRGAPEFKLKDGHYIASDSRHGVLATFREVEVCAWWRICGTGCEGMITANPVGTNT